MVAEQAIEALRACGQLMEDRRPKRPARLELPQPQEERLSVVLEGIAPGAKLALYRLEAQGSLFSTEDNRAADAADAAADAAARPDGPDAAARRA